MFRILVVDDSKFMRVTIKKILERDEKLKVVGEAETGREAVEKYKELKPDLVIMDIIMPAESGLSAVKHIHEFDREAKVIMVSAIGQESIVEEATQSGVKGFFVKPVEPEKLIKKVNDVLLG